MSWKAILKAEETIEEALLKIFNMFDSGGQIVKNDVVTIIMAKNGSRGSLKKAGLVTNIGWYNKVSFGDDDEKGEVTVTPKYAGTNTFVDDINELASQVNTKESKDLYDEVAKNPAVLYPKSKGGMK